MPIGRASSGDDRALHQQDRDGQREPDQLNRPLPAPRDRLGQCVRHRCTPTAPTTQLHAEWAGAAGPGGSQGDRDGQLLTLPVDEEWDGIARVGASDLLNRFQRVRGLSVDGYNHVAGLQPRRLGR